MANRANLIVPETWIESLEAFGNVQAIAPPILDTLWQSFDEPRCREYDSNGNWNGGDPFVALLGLWRSCPCVPTHLKCWSHRCFVVQVTLEAGEKFADFVSLPEIGNGVRNRVVIFEA